MGEMTGGLIVVIITILIALLIFSMYQLVHAYLHIGAMVMMAGLFGKEYVLLDLSLTLSDASKLALLLIIIQLLSIVINYIILMIFESLFYKEDGSILLGVLILIMHHHATSIITKSVYALMGYVINTLIMLVYFDKFNIVYDGLLSVLIYSCIITILTNRTWNFLRNRMYDGDDDNYELVIVAEVDKEENSSSGHKKK